jgi:SPP1 gp7 family putative phage head morphogenesis protein
MILPIPLKKDIRGIAKDIDTSIQETLTSPLASFNYEQTDNPLNKDWEEGKIHFVDGRIKGRLSKQSIKYLQNKNQDYDNGYYIDNPEILLFIAHKGIKFTERKEQSLKFLKTMETPDIGLSPDKIFETIDKVEEKAKRVLGVDKLEMGRNTHHAMYEALEKSSLAYFALLTLNLTNNINNATTNSEITKSLNLRIAQLKRKAFNLADEMAYYFAGQARINLYKNYGAKFFIWKTMGDDKVRLSHQALNGQTFEYENPPYVDGVQRLPTEDYGCRCIDIPIINKES